MTFLPIVERELRVAARRRSTYVNRFSVALAGLLFGGLILLFGFWGTQQSGAPLFYFLAVLSFFYSGFAGVLTTADCLSEEKREGTLGLLFLTDLKGYDIVFGKLAATSLNTIYALLAVFPVMVIPVMMGGVNGAEIGRVVLVCMNNLFFSLALGIFCSSISRDERSALVRGLGLLVLLAAGLPILTALLYSRHEHNELVRFFLLPSPGYACVMAFEAPYAGAGKWQMFYPSVLTIHFLSWSLLLAACSIVPRTWQETGRSARAMRRQQWWQRFAQGSAERRAVVRRRLLAVNPFYWLTGRDRMKIIAVWLPVGLGAFIWGLGLRYNRRDWLSEPLYVITALIAHTTLKLWVATEACRQLAHDRNSGALELLLVTPVRVKEIISGQLRALAKQFGPVAFFVVALDCVFALTDRADKEWMQVWMAGTAIFVLDMATLSVVGMWRGLNSRSANRAAGTAIVRVLVLPWVLFLLLWITIVVGTMTQRLTGMDWNQLFILAWFGISLVIDLIFGISAWYHLHTHFRVASAQRITGKR